MFSLLFLLTVDDTARLLSFTFAFLPRCKTKTTTTTMFWGGVPSLKVDKQRKCGGQKKKKKEKRKELWKAHTGSLWKSTERQPWDRCRNDGTDGCTAATFYRFFMEHVLQLFLVELSFN
ncbi:hypothetical protein IscW_ISCW023155 [Ixodes scapularis]|uniref:Uncharacterized protein n=1 Tax=Ixodes scapularis TaxID=6945 RepID=B7QHT9_IXOSC|nr:hypothetical protein IscW_ISCW023155 [Ixodes scapularis]|eukprot:XP_002414746.1 hypothetical protein IscW_ISCW023155 [Ixodes scapularis]